MTVLSAIQAVCPVIGLDVPSAVFASTEREHVELRALANEMATRIYKEHDWNTFKAIATISGDGSTASFSRPVDYGRMLKEGQIWSSARKDTPLTHVTDSDIWLADSMSGNALDNPEWTVIGSSIYVTPTVPSGETLKYFYIKKLTAFAADTDVFALDERLLTLGMIWQWKAQKGLPYAEDLANYEIELSTAIKEDRGADILSVGSSRTRAHDDYSMAMDYTP